MAQVYAKVWRVRGEVLVAICDEEFLGRRFEDKEQMLVFEVRESFYNGGKMGVDEAIKLLRQATLANLTGPRITEAAVKAGYIDKPGVEVICGIPHAQIVKM